jgi:fucose 4-O-acetylase-like acetyltransferase
VEHLPWGLDIALFAQGFILTGRWLRAKGLENLSGIWSLFLPLFLLVAQSHVNDYFNMAARMYGSYPLLAYAAAIGGSILLMRIMQLLVHDAASDAHGCASADAGAGRAAFASAFPAEMGRRSMAIYVLHPFVQIIITDALLCTFINGDYGTVFNLWQAGIPITVLGILIPVYVSRHWAQKPILRHLGI